MWCRHAHISHHIETSQLWGATSRHTIRVSRHSPLHSTRHFRLFTPRLSRRREATSAIARSYINSVISYPEHWHYAFIFLISLFMLSFHWYHFRSLSLRRVRNSHFMLVLLDTSFGHNSQRLIFIMRAYQHSHSSIRSHCTEFINRLSSTVIRHTNVISLFSRQCSFIIKCHYFTTQSIIQYSHTSLPFPRQCSILLINTKNTHVLIIKSVSYISLILQNTGRFSACSAFRISPSCITLKE